MRTTPRCIIMQFEFESDVISDSGKTLNVSYSEVHMFESDVISDSGKTPIRFPGIIQEFESDVISDSGKTCRRTTRP